MATESGMLADLQVALRLLRPQEPETIRRAVELLASETSQFRRRAYNGEPRGIIPHVVHESIDDVLADLEDTTARQYLYRGQVRRYPTYIFWDQEVNRFLYESLLPHSFRFIADYDRPTPELQARFRTAREEGLSQSQRLMESLIGLCSDGLEREDPVFAWSAQVLKEAVAQQALDNDVSRSEIIKKDILRGEVSNLCRSGLLRIRWSLAQHYGVSTTLIDLTDSPRIAAWFATNPWDRSKPMPTVCHVARWAGDACARSGPLVSLCCTESSTN